LFVARSALADREVSLKMFELLPPCRSIITQKQYKNVTRAAASRNNNEWGGIYGFGNFG
jgi:hypothetical protein